MQPGPIIRGALGGGLGGAVFAVLDVLLTLPRVPVPAEGHRLAQMILVAALTYPPLGALAGLGIAWATSRRATASGFRSTAGIALAVVIGSSTVLYAWSWIFLRTPDASSSFRAIASVAAFVVSLGIAATLRRLTATWAPTRAFVLSTFAAWTGLVIACRAALPIWSSVSGNVPRPNERIVIVVTADTTRADALGCYGNPGVTTPNLDRLASEGALFLRAQAASSWTLPSHASMFTGLTVPETGIEYFSSELPSNHATIAELFRARGFQTAAVVSTLFTSSMFGFGRGFTSFDDEYAASWRWLAGPAVLRKLGRLWPALDLPADRRATEVVDRGIPHLRRGGPLFLWLHFFDPHSDYDPPFPYRTAEASEARPPFDGKTEPLVQVNHGGVAPPGTDDLRRLRALYDGEVSYMDAQIGRLRAEIERAGLRESTAIVVVGDHGEAFEEHGRLLHANLYEEVLHVPLIIWAPGRVNPGWRVSEVVRGMDIAPTLADLGGIPWAGSGNGARSVLSLVEKHEETQRLARSDREETGPDDPQLRHEAALLSWPWKLIVVPGRRTELYDLEKDPGEKNNVADQAPAVLSRLEGLLEADRRRAPVGKEHDLSPELRARLRSLGYLM
ncbi:MAG: sulfatase-like hydrolase/transferase [Thermoanaerobaculia bacterium]